MERMDESDQTLSEVAAERWTLAWLASLVLAVACLYTFSGLAGDVWVGEELSFDRPVMETLHDLTSPWLTAVMWGVTVTGSTVASVGMTLGLGIYWWQKVGLRIEAYVLAVTMAVSAALGQLLKFFFARPRPDLFPWLTYARGWSFPSGHTLTVVTYGGVLVWLIGHRLPFSRRVVLWAIVGTWVGLVGVSRVYLGVHYPSDVLASLAIGPLFLLVAFYVCRAIGLRLTR
jgi:undecaprenyl-diphosphatase